MRRILATFLLVIVLFLVSPPLFAMQSGLGGGGQSNIGGGGGGSGGGSGAGPVFNVFSNFSAPRNTVESKNCAISSLTNLNCTDLTFTSAFVGRHVSCSSTNGTVFLNGAQTIIAFVDAHDVTVSASNGPSGVACVIGTPDDTAVTNAVTAAVAAVCSVISAGNVCQPSTPPVLYFPGCCYSLFNTSINITPTGGGNSGFVIRGDGLDVTKVYWHAGSNPAAGSQVALTMSNVTVDGITFDGGSQGGQVGSGAVAQNGNNTLVKNVQVQNFSTAALWNSAGGIYADHLVTLGGAGIGFLCNPCGGELYESVFSNNGSSGIDIQNTTGLTGGPGLRVVNSLVDENTGAGGTLGCSVRVQGSTDIWFQGTSIYSSSSAPLCGLGIDGHSLVHWAGGVTGMFGTTEPNRNGIIILAGGVLQMSDVRATGSGTGFSINNAGTLNDNGGNSSESAFPIASGTSTGTAAVLTVTTNGANANTNCAVGDALMVQGATISGYNGYYPAGAASGITAVTATTISYTTAGSNLGTLTAGGFAFCRNLLTYTGNLPRALLNNPIPNTCYLTITPITNATTFNLCNWGAGQATNITRITASSQVVTTCATAPIVTISNGTVSETLTLTSGKQFWDSFNNQDASTGVGTTIFKPSISLTGTDRITIKYDAGALSSCTTPPTNLGLTYTISPILSN